MAVAPLIYGGVLLVYRSVVDPKFPLESAFLLLFAAALGAAGLGLLVTAHYGPRLMVRTAIKRGRPHEQAVLSPLIFRASAYSNIAVFGLILGVMGASWMVYVPFLGVGFVALLVTFPTDSYVADLLARATPKPTA
jgi:hypothetical protein